MQEKMTILVVDDNHSDIQAYEKHVTSCGLPYRLDFAHSTAQAKAMLAENVYEAMILDMDLEGPENELLVNGDAIPAIVTTKPGNEEAAARAMQNGALDCLVKDPNSGYLSMLAVTLEKALKQRKADDFLRMLEHSMQAVTDSVCIMDMSDTIIFVNKAFCRTYGYAEKEIQGKPMRILWPEDADDSQTAQAFSVKEKENWSGEVHHQRKDGALIDMHFNLSVIPGPDGKVQALIGVARSLSADKATQEQLKASLEEKEVLLKEVHHRVKNNLQVVSSLLNLQSSYISDPATSDVLRDSQNRVKSMALIHERLYRSTNLNTIDFGDYVRNLVTHIKSSFKKSGSVTVDTRVGDIVLDVDVAIPCGLIVNELLSNALKHAFRAKNEGRVTVTMDRGTRARYALSVCDNGDGFPPGENMLQKTESLGLQLVNTLTQQLMGEITLTSKPETCVCVEFSPPAKDDRP